MTPILEREVKEHKDESEATKAIVVGRDLQRIQRDSLRQNKSEWKRHRESSIQMRYACPRASLEKIISSYAPLKISKPPLDTSKKQIAEHSKPSQ
ncbi:hypothetical protein E5676_scaffold95G001060 [Cucumis melo var. makuwa]|uniref:Uncharacterized protein n=1 Tax=Cucumis melo var. makuwa TaxID=1194695 RepID=A0A5A7TK42_CUCMM|nr:hypothetical protein E6C27_scaffold67G001780 [Cucumis melo var. makuwa]TYK27094.1 hypothetical protein E5676_scaffold95G001060 [Cucumis melo var. makuwa]